MRASPRRQAKRAPVGTRALFVEQLEDRRLLAAGSAWHNPLFPLDVNNDGIVGAADLSVLLDYLRISGVGAVPARDPQHPPQFYYDINGDNSVSPIDALILLSRFQIPTRVTLSTLVPSSVDVTPQLTVSATSPAALPNGRAVQVDVDLNNDGNFTGAEVGYSQSTLFNGSATFDLLPALPASLLNAAYPIRLQAHVQDSDGVVGFSSVQSMTINTAPSNALKTYVLTPDSSYHIDQPIVTPVPGLVGSIPVPVLFTVYDVSMTSQTWRSTADVDQPIWKHWVRIIVPSPLTGPISNTALLLINGGSYSSTPPAIDDTIAQYGQAAVSLHAVLVDLEDVPNEPLTFVNDTLHGHPEQGDPLHLDRSEDEIIAYTMNQFLNNIGQAGNNTWPALLPMVKSAVRAMDTAQTVVPAVSGNLITNFMVTGYSKRGWTTWLTAAVDSRVTAIIPGVFDNLNQGEQMVHQYQVYGFFSQAVQDYNDLNIFGRITTPAGQQLSSIVDPYYYLSDPRMTMPKLEINSAGDEFFVSDSAQFYFHDLPGTQNYLRYIPNVGHGLGEGTNFAPINSTISFYDAVVNHHPLPQFSWVVQPDGSIRVKTTDAPSQVLMWQATNPVSRDFRHLFNPTIVWTSSVLTDQGGGVYVGSAPTPAHGATAFFVELTYPSSIQGDPFVFTTEIHENYNPATTPLFSWPPPQPLALPAIISAIANSGTVISGLESTSFAGLTQAAGAPLAIFGTIVPAGLPAVMLPGTILPGIMPTDASSRWLAATPTTIADNSPGSVKSCDDESNADLVDHVFGQTLDDVLA